jgi:peptidyl-prolyl cis-trans isomerase C
MLEAIHLMGSLFRLSCAVLITLTSVSFARATGVSVNGRVITDADLAAVVAQLPGKAKDDVLKDPAAKAQILSTLVNQELLFQDATSRKVQASKDYKLALEAFKKQLAVELLVRNQITSKISTSAVKNYFEKNKKQYSNDAVHALHILTKTANEAQAILAEVKKPGVDFQMVAEKRSIDPAAKTNRGDLGFFGHGMLDAGFTDAAFAAKTNQIIGPIKSAFGYHVIKVLEKKAGKPAEFSEAEPRARSDLQRDMIESYLTNLKKRSKIKGM